MTDAGTLEVTETIEHLEPGEFTCYATDCEEKAAWLYHGGCTCTTYACTPHKEEWLNARDDMLAIAELLGVGADALCTRCGAKCDAKDVQAWPL
jgi:hypothetical protein